MHLLNIIRIEQASQVLSLNTLSYFAVTGRRIEFHCWLLDWEGVSQELFTLRQLNPPFLVRGTHYRNFILQPPLHPRRRTIAISHLYVHLRLIPAACAALSKQPCRLLHRSHPPLYAAIPRKLDFAVLFAGLAADVPILNHNRHLTTLFHKFLNSFVVILDHSSVFRGLLPILTCLRPLLLLNLLNFFISLRIYRLLEVQDGIFIIIRNLLFPPMIAAVRVLVDTH